MNTRTNKFNPINSWLIVGLLAGLLAGCTTVTTKQTDESPERTITTTTTAFTLFKGKAELAGLKSSQTDKSQSTAITGLKQEGQESLNELVSTAISAAVKAAVPDP